MGSGFARRRDEVCIHWHNGNGWDCGRGDGIGRVVTRFIIPRADQLVLKDTLSAV